MAYLLDGLGSRRLIVLTVAVCCLVLATFIGSLATLGFALHNRSLSDAGSVAAAVQHYALRVVTSGDLLSQMAADAILARGSLDGIGTDAELNATLRRLVGNLPEGSGMAIIDTSGQMVAFSRPMPANPVDLSDRQWFRAHTEQGVDLVISEALLSRVTGTVMFIMTRAIRAPDRTLLGIVNLGVPAGSLIGNHGLPQYGKGIVLTLTNFEGGLVARSDFPESLIGQRLDVSRLSHGQARIVWNRAVDGRAAVEAAAFDPDRQLIAHSSIPLTDVFRPLLVVFSLGLPIVLGVLWGAVVLMRSLMHQQRQLMRTSARLKAVLDASHLGAWHFDIRRNTSEMNDRWARIVGHDPDEVSTSTDEWIRRLHPDEQGPVLLAMQDALSGKTPFFHMEHRMRHKDGHWIWVLDSGTVVERDAEGRPLVITGTLLDISERRDAEQRLRMMMRELDHRAKNLLAVVYSIINLMKSDSVADFKRAILGRVQALGHVHSLLSQAGWQGVEMGRLIATETAAYQADGGPRVMLDGPELTLSPAAAQAVAVVIHELMTNSAKYGALSTATGEVSLEWSCPPDRGGNISLVWQDRGGPPVSAPERRGFGTTLLTTMVQDQLDGKVSADWRPDGAVFTVRFPAHHLRAPQVMG